MATKYAGNILNTNDTKVIDHKVYCLCGDGDLQEGISYEACSLAGVQNLDNLVLIYDSNNITIEGNTSIAWNEDIKTRFEAQGWMVARINGHDFEEIDFVLNESKKQTKPFLIIADTIIAKGACELEGSHHSHGAPLGVEEIKNAKKKCGFDPEIDFFVDEDVKFKFALAIEEGDLHEAKWNKMIKEALNDEQKSLLDALINPDFSKISWQKYDKDMATRDSNGEIINAIAKVVPGFLGGSADLGPSNKSELKNMGDFPYGRNMHFGIREHAMASICNAFALYGLFIPYSATFFIFSDYLKPSVRLASLMKLKTFYIWTHDSIGVGEDGPTHQPIEQLTQFRALPNFQLFRPADANENVACWQVALNSNAPSAFVCSRQKLPLLKGDNGFGEVKNGAYLLKGVEDATVTLLASGSEVSLALKASEALANEGILANVVSVPCFTLFNTQTQEYKQEIIKPNTKTLAIEAGAGLEWYRYAKRVICMESFGASGDANKLFEHFGFSVENIVKTVKEL